MLWLIIIIVLVILLVASVPAYPYSRGWGYSPVGGVAAILVILILLWLFGVISINVGGTNTSGGGVPATRVTGSPSR
ncbi:MAG: DUF3309 family protein [Thermomicrobiales bacterium]|jgi:hypothetical protein|nr:DUF3309 family protein [Thermomicrobiales bacterium]